jgi:hypothetical protein
LLCVCFAVGLSVDSVSIFADGSNIVSAAHEFHAAAAYSVCEFWIASNVFFLFILMFQ